MISYGLYAKVKKRTLPGGLKRGPRKKYNRRFPEGVQKEESNNDDKHDHSTNVLVGICPG